MVYPVQTVHEPAALNGVTNGKIPAAKVRSTPSLHDGKTIVLLAVAMRSFLAMRAAAEKTGIHLEAVSSYRTYAEQEAIFRERYVPHYAVHTDGTVSYRTWNGVRWYHAFGAKAALPGTSNHGRGLAIDFITSDRWLTWMLANAGRFGWSWEIQEEKWHLHYYAGDAIPAAVLAYEHATTPAPTDAPIDEETLMLFQSPGGSIAHLLDGQLVLVHGKTPTRADTAQLDRIKAALPPHARTVVKCTVTHWDRLKRAYGIVD